MNNFLVTTLCLFALSASTRADTDDDKKAVSELVRNTVNKVLVVMKDEKLSRLDKRKKVMDVIEPVVEFRLMAKLTLGRKHWSKLKAEQHESFTKLFIETLKASYFEKLDLFSDEVVEFNDPVAKKTKFHVVTYIVSKGERTEVAYKLYRKGTSWKVYDFEIEGVSIVTSYGSQYNDFLREGSFEELLTKMREKIKAARKKESESGTPAEKTNRKDKSA